jgi:hypothetical protein
VLDFVVGGGGGGLVGVGAAIGVLNISNNARASAAGTLWAGGQVRINGTLQEQADQHTFAFGFGFVGLGASVSVMSVSSTSQAALANGAVLNNAASVNINANTQQAFRALTVGAQGGAVAVGASFARIAVGNSGATDTYAGIGANARVGTGQGTVGNITIKAQSNITIDMDTFAMAGGLVGVTANFAFADISADVLADVGAGTRLSSSGNLSVLAGTDHSAKVNVFSLSVGGAAIGLSLARANISPTVTASVGGDIAVGGNITINASHNVDPATGAPIESALANRAALNRLAAARSNANPDTHAGVTEVADGSAHGAYAVAEAPAVGLITAKFSLATAISAANVFSRIKAGSVINAGGTVGLTANGVDQSKARGKGFSISGAGFGLLNADAQA